MNIDLLPITAFALQSCGRAAQGAGEGQTLTLQLGLAPALCSRESMSGSGGINQAFVPSGNLLRAAVVPTEGPALTITF